MDQVVALVDKTLSHRKLCKLLPLPEFTQVPHEKLDAYSIGKYRGSSSSYMPEGDERSI